MDSPVGLSNDIGGRGWFGTVQVGCDYQFGSNFVIGAFGDYDFASIKGDMAVPALGIRRPEKLKNSWAAGGRIGYLPFQPQQLLVYVSGGYTQARFDAVAFGDFGGADTVSPLRSTPTMAGSSVRAMSISSAGSRSRA